LVPRTPDDFAKRWKESPERKELVREIEAYTEEHKFGESSYEKFALSRNTEKSNKQRENSPYTLSYFKQIELCMWRELQKLKNDPSVTIAMLVSNFFEALIISSIFYNLSGNTSSFFHRGAVLFMLMLLNAFGSILEIISLYAKRTIVEKHNRYALYHPSAEAVSSMIMDMPYKILNSILVNTTLYFMSNLRREPGPFFFFLLVSFTTTLSMSMFFRWLASITKTIAQALAPSSIILLALVLYTGFAIPISYMRGWAHWIRYINPVAYGFESIMVNEFHGREFECASFVPSGPGYENVSDSQQVCSVVGSVPASSVVNGDSYLRSAFNYSYVYRWRNFGIIVVLVAFLGFCHLITSELVASERSKGEVLVYRRGKMQRAKEKESQPDEERTGTPPVQTEKHDSGLALDIGIEKQTSVFHWKNVCYEIKIKKEKRVILNHIDGWVKPGTLTALMVRYDSHYSALVFDAPRNPGVLSPSY
jgi:ABC-type multidrug transport system permease subunit